MVDKKLTLDDLVESILATKPKYVQERYRMAEKETKLSLKELMNNSELGIISSVTFGATDRGVMLSFGIMLDESVGTLAQLTAKETTEFIIDYDVEDTKDLIGKPIKVVKSINRIIWLEPCKIKLRK